MIYLDTHVVAWLYAGATRLLSTKARDAIVGHALAAGHGLLTKDRSIRRRVRAAFW